MYLPSPISRTPDGADIVGEGGTPHCDRTLNLGDTGFQDSAPQLENPFPGRLPSPLSPPQLLSQVGCSSREVGCSPREEVTPAQPAAGSRGLQESIKPVSRWSRNGAQFQGHRVYAALANQAELGRFRGRGGGGATGSTCSLFLKI